MKLCKHCKEEKCEFDFAFSYKYSCYRDICKKCVAKKTTNWERVKLTKNMPAQTREFYRVRKSAPK